MSLFRGVSRAGRVVSRVDRAMKTIDLASKAKLMEAGFHMRNELVKKVQPPPPRTGIHYKGQRQRSSAPGEPPAKQEGDLQRSILPPRYKTGAQGGEVHVGSISKVGVFLERGTSKMKARPWFKTTWEQEKSEVKRILGGKWF